MLCEELLYRYKNKTAHKFIGDIILTVCKKEDSSQQSLWNTDSSRQTFIIKEALDDNTSSWVIDKNGKKTTFYIIKPVLDQLKDKLLIHNNNMVNMVQITDDADKAVELVDKMKILAELSKDIGIKVMHKEILKYISPSLYVDSKNV